MKRMRGTKMALRRGTWVIRKWQEDWIRVWGFWASDFKIIQPGKRKECSESFCKHNSQQRVDWFSHNSPLHIFTTFVFSWISAHSKPAELLCLWGCHPRFFLISLSFRHRSLAVHLERFPAWLRGSPVSVQPGSEPVCIWADSVSPCQKGLITDNNLCEPIFLPLLE